MRWNCFTHRNFEQMKTRVQPGILMWMLCMVLYGTSPLQAQNGWNLDKEAIDSVLELQYFSTRMPGYAMCIVKDGEIVYSGLRGKANVRDDIKMSLTTQFNIGSVTKQFTAAAIYLLEEQGKLSLQDPVQKYIPEFPTYPTPITIEMLLHHTSGIRDHLEVAILLSRYKEKYSTLDGMLDWVIKYPELNTPPGTYFAYSNTNYMLLAVVIERLSGQSYAQYLQDNIFTPLGMKNTYVEDKKEKYHKDRTTHYEINFKQTKAKRAETVMNALGAVGVISTLEDMVLWDNNFSNNKLGNGSNALPKKMFTSGVTVDGTEVNYGGGFLLKTYRNMQVQEHSGGWGEYLTQYRRFPDEHVSIIICVNAYLISPFEMADNVSNTLFQFKNVHILVQPVVPEDLKKEIQGGYAAENNLIRYIYEKKGELFIARISEGDTTAYPLKYVGGFNGNQAFMDTTGHSVVIQYSGGKPHDLVWAEGTYFVTNRVYYKIDTETPVNYNKYQGKYYCAAYDKKLRIQYFSREDELTIHPFPFVEYQINSKGGDYYQVAEQPYIVHFGNGHFVFGNDWTFNIRFEKKAKKQIDWWPFGK